MAKVYFKRKTTQEIEELPVEDGSLIYNTDNGKTYMDFNNERIQTGGNADTMIAIGGEEPTDPDIKIWFPDNVVNTKASEVVNSMEGNETDRAGSVDAVKKYIDGTLLWKNENPDEDFESDSISLTDWQNYDFWEVIFRSSTTENFYFSTGKIPKFNGTRLNYCTGNSSGVVAYSRNIANNGGPTLAVSTAQTFNSSGQSNTNDRCIPIYVIGYKSNLIKEVQ